MRAPVQRAAAPAAGTDPAAREAARIGAHVCASPDASGGAARSGFRVAEPPGCPRRARSTGSAHRCPAASRARPSPAGGFARDLQRRGERARRRRCRRRCPRCAASARAVSIDSASLPARSRSATARFSTAGTKSGVQPWILCGAKALPASSAAVLGLGGDDPHLRPRELDHLAGAGQRAAGAPAGDEVVEPPAGEVSRISGPVVLRW